MFKYSHALKIKFSAELENIDKAAEKTKTFLTELGKEPHIFTVSLLMREALINAVAHGCKCDKEKTVLYQLICENKDLVIKVIDSGKGFDWRAKLSQIPQPESECGRGLCIMEAYADKLKYNEKGNSLVLKMNLSEGGLNGKRNCKAV